jgi:hypothetical protein
MAPPSGDESWQETAAARVPPPPVVALMDLVALMDYHERNLGRKKR